MVKSKKVGFNFFRPIIEFPNGNTKIFDFAYIFENIREEYSKARERTCEENEQEKYKLVYRYNNEPARLADIKIDYESQYFHLIFERLEYQVPFRTTLHGESEIIELEDDEYIGLDVNVLYDPVHHIFMIQRNRDSLGPSGIELFLKTLIDKYVEEVEGVFNLAIVNDNTARKRAFRLSAYRKIHLKVYGLKAKGIIEKLTGSKNNVSVDSIEISFNSSSTKDGKMDETFAKQILEEYIDDEEVHILKVRGREDEDGKVEPIDLIDHKLQAFHVFEFKEDRKLHPISVFDVMRDIYDNKGFRIQILGM